MSTTDRVRTATDSRTVNIRHETAGIEFADQYLPSGNGTAWLARSEVDAVLDQRRGYLALKRLFDAFNAALQLVLFAPIFLLAMLSIKLYDRGPVFFHQERITGGPDGPRHFKILKFRTMVVDAEALGAKITGKTDPRITPIGKLMRKFKIDEIPQLVNILRGDMSFVGPRPQTLGYAEHFRDHYDLIHSVVRAGLTDLASIRFKDEGGILSAASDPERVYIEKIMPAKIRTHQEYVRNMNLALDMKILWLTIVRVFLKR